VKMPESVKVGPFPYRIERVKDLRAEWNRNQRCYGTVDHESHVIRVDEDNQPDRAEATFWHESLHAIDATLTIGLSEKQTTRLAVGLLMFLRDNHLLREE
jgi:hypothetical protein